MAPDPRFERQGDHLTTTLTVSAAQAALGTEAEVETLDGPQTVTVAPGTQHGHVERLRGLGVPHLRGRGRGDLFVHVLVTTPTGLSAEQEQLLRDFAAARGEDVLPPGSGGEGASSIGSTPDCVFGNAITSRMFVWKARSAAQRSMPSAIPPCGGAP